MWASSREHFPTESKASFEGTVMFWVLLAFLDFMSFMAGHIQHMSFGLT